MQTINEFYEGKSVFITGASGFMGKVLIEKLLWSCPGVKQVFILMREKKGKSGSERVAEFSKLPLFERIVKIRPELLSKVKPVYGDICSVDLGLSNEALDLIISHTNIIFHMAATVNFEAPLKSAVEMNVRGVDYVMKLAKQMSKLNVMVHLSTTFCCCDQNILREEVYDCKINPKSLIKCVEWMDEQTMNCLKETLIPPHPNTYTFTKRVAELLVRDEYPNLPVVIARPSIVLPSFSEPCPGWIDNLNGPMGVILGGGKGVIRSMLCDGDAHAEAIPVDLAINALIIIAWNFATMKEKPHNIPVFNVTIPENLRYSWKFLLELGRTILLKYPFEAGIWYPGGDITQSKFIHHTRVFFTQLIPAYLVDGLCLLLGRKRFLVKIQRKISAGMKMLQYFSMTKWDFRSENVVRMRKEISLAEKEVFPTELLNIDVADYLKNCILGGRQFCLKEPLSTLPKARTQLKVLRVLDVLMSLIYFLLFGWICKRLFLG